MNVDKETTVITDGYGGSICLTDRQALLLQFILNVRLKYRMHGEIPIPEDREALGDVEEEPIAD